MLFSLLARVTKSTHIKKVKDFKKKSSDFARSRQLYFFGQLKIAAFLFKAEDNNSAFFQRQ